MKGISTIIASILLVIITISLAGTAYLFIGGVLTGQTSKIIKLLDAKAHTIIIQNLGTESISSDEIRVLVDGEQAEITNPQIIEPLDIVFLKFVPPDFGNELISAKVNVIGPSNSLNYVINIVPHELKIIDGTLGLWHFNEGSGTTIRDETGVNDGTSYSGAVETDLHTSNSKFGSALYFDGVDDYVNIPMSSQDFTAFTIEFWMYPTSYGAGFGRHVFRCGNPWTTGSILIYLYSNVNSRLTCGIQNDVDTRVPLPNDVIDSLNKWYHIVFVWDGTNEMLYVNGVKAPTEDSITGTVAGGYIQIAFNTDDFMGIIDEVRVLNRALTHEEILDSIYG